MKKLLLAALTLACASAQAELGHTDDYGFEVKIERTVTASQTKAYQQMLNVGQWWNKDHTWFGESDKMYIEPKVQGCFCEINGDKQALHMTVSYVDPNNEIRMIGGLGPLQSLGVHGGMSFKFEKLAEHKTKIVFNYKVVGTMQGGLKPLAPVVDKVLTLQLDNLAGRF